MIQIIYLCFNLNWRQTMDRVKSRERGEADEKVSGGMISLTHEAQAAANSASFLQQHTPPTVFAARQFLFMTQND